MAESHGLGGCIERMASTRASRLEISSRGTSRLRVLLYDCHYQQTELHGRGSSYVLCGRRFEARSQCDPGFPGHGVPLITYARSDATQVVFLAMTALSRTSLLMPRSSRFSGELQGRIPRIARRLRSRMNELGVNQTELAARCTGASHSLFPEQQAPPITRERIAKILMHCKAHPGKSAARVISHPELQVLASVLQVSPEWLAGNDDSRDLVLWDPLADPQRAHHILHLINEHEDNATELLVWAEYLICSLVTPEFMHKHHEALFSELDVLGAHDEKRKVVQVYDNIGTARRKHLLDSRRKNRRLIQFIFASDIEKIVRGESEYATIPQGVRRACLENLCKLITDPGLGIELVVVSDEAASGIKIAFRDYDSLGVFDESFVLWRYHSGRIAWSEHSGHARSHRDLLKKLQNSAIARTRDDALQIVKRYVESITD